MSRRCWHESRTSTPRWGLPRISTRSCTATCSRRSVWCSATLRLRTSCRPGARSTGTWPAPWSGSRTTCTHGSRWTRGDVWRDLVVCERVQQSPDTVAYGLARPDGTALPKALPGQYISVQVRLADGARQIRQYSLTRAPRQEQWGITVKAVPAGTIAGVGIPAGELSNSLHQNVFEGDYLSCSLPYGDLILHDRPDPLLLVSAGIGCTPIIGMLHYLARTNSDRDITVLHADQSPGRHAHRRELSDLVEQTPSARLIHWYEDLGVRSSTGTVRRGLIDLDDIPIDPRVRAYLCGPPVFMDVVRQHLVNRHVPQAHVSYEVFGPDTWTPTAPAA
nr:FAD-binding oxidoreductase [Leekyejoonella antrihumi]